MGPTSKGRGGALLLRRGRGGEGKGEGTVEEGEEKEGKGLKSPQSKFSGYVAGDSEVLVK